MKEALGMIETYGYVVAIEALDSALKAANVRRVLVALVKGGLVSVMIEGDVGAVKAAVSAAGAAAGRIGTVYAMHVIPRPDQSVWQMISPKNSFGRLQTGMNMSEETLRAMRVTQLRSLARQLQITNMTARDIRFGRKEEIIQKILEFQNNRKE